MIDRLPESRNADAQAGANEIKELRVALRDVRRVLFALIKQNGGRVTLDHRTLLDLDERAELVEYEERERFATTYGLREPVLPDRQWGSGGNSADE